MQKFHALQLQKRVGVAHRRSFAAVLECACHACQLDRGAPRPTPLRCVRLGSVMVSTAPAMLSGEVDFWMHNTHVTCQCIVAGESLFLDTQCAADFLLARVVNRVFVPGKIVRTGEDRAARLAGSGVDALTLVWAGL